MGDRIGSVSPCTAASLVPDTVVAVGVCGLGTIGSVEALVDTCGVICSFAAGACVAAVGDSVGKMDCGSDAIRVSDAIDDDISDDIAASGAERTAYRNVPD